MVCDWAPAYFHAVSRIVLDRSFVQLINDHHNNPDSIPLCKLRICSSHFMHAKARYCDANLPADAKHLKKIICGIFGLLVRAQTLEEFENLAYKSLFTVSNRFDTAQVKRFKSEILEMANNLEVSLDKPSETETEDDNNNFKAEIINCDNENQCYALGKGQRNSIEYSKVIDKILNSALNNAKSEEEATSDTCPVNPWYDKKSVLCSMYQQYLHLVSIWGECFYGPRKNQGLIEGYNNELKTGILRGRENVRLGQYIEIIYKSIEGKLNIASVPILGKIMRRGKPQSRKSSQSSTGSVRYLSSVTSKSTSASEPDIYDEAKQEEKYGKKQKRKPSPHSHVTGFYLRKELEKISKQTEVIHEKSQIVEEPDPCPSFSLVPNPTDNFENLDDFTQPQLNPNPKNQICSASFSPQQLLDLPKNSSLLPYTRVIDNVRLFVIPPPWSSINLKSNAENESFTNETKDDSSLAESLIDSSHIESKSSNNSNPVEKIEIIELDDNSQYPGTYFDSNGIPYTANKLLSAEHRERVITSAVKLPLHSPSGIVAAPKYHPDVYPFFAFHEYFRCWLSFDNFLSMFVDGETRGWLDIDLVDFLLKLKFEKEHSDKSYLFIPCAQSIEFFINGSGNSKNFTNKNAQFIVMPILQPRHYVVAIADTIRKIFYYFNSSETSFESEPTALKRMRIFATARGEIDQWKLEIPIKSKLQVDSHSCGIFVIKFILCFFEDKAYLEETMRRLNEHEILQERTILQDYLLKNSDNILEFCPICIKEVEKVVYRCFSCQRAIHPDCFEKSSTCLKYSNKTICFTCVNYFIQ